jgi:RNA polymerase sigma-70 factor, ECF subfamily
MKGADYRGARGPVEDSRQLFDRPAVVQLEIQEMLRMEDRTVTRETFASIVREYSRAVFNIAYRIANDREDAMDITQTSFLKAYERLDTYDPSCKIFSWLYKIAVNEAINCVNRRKRLEPLGEDDAALDPGPEEECAQNETSRELQRALLDINLEYRTVVVLRHFQNLSYREIGDILDIPEKTVKSRLFTGRRLLKDVLLKQGYTP